MSRRATIHFQSYGQDAAIVYRHSDGYPTGLGSDLETFFDECQQLPDNRFGDPSYLAAKWIVADSARFVTGDHRLAFLGVGVVLDDPSDIEYRYLVACNGGRPTVKIESVR